MRRTFGYGIPLFVFFASLLLPTDGSSSASSATFLSASPSIAAVLPQRRSIPSPLQTINPSYESSILLRWWLPVAFFDYYQTTLPSFYEIAYQPVSPVLTGEPTDPWYPAANVTGYDLDAPYGLREVQRIIFRSSNLGTNNEADAIYFRLTLTDTAYTNFDRERQLITPRLPYNITASALETELNKLDPVRLTYGPVHVERDSSGIQDNLYQWRITFSYGQGTVPLPVPLLYITEQYAPSTTAVDTTFTVDRINNGRGITDDKRNACIATSPDDIPNICSHSFTGLLPGYEYRFRLRAYMNHQFSEYSLPSEKVMFPRTVTDSIVSSAIPSPLLSSLTENSVTLLVQLPYSRNDNRQVPSDDKPMVRIQVQMAQLGTNSNHNLTINEDYRWQSVNGIVDKRTNIITNSPYRSSDNPSDNNLPSPFTVATTVTVDNLEAGSRYAFRIRGIAIPRDDTGYTNNELTSSPSLSNNRLSLWSNPLTNVLTLPSAPVPPTMLPLQRSDIHHDSVILRWYYPQPTHKVTALSSYVASFIPSTRIIGYRVQYRQISSSLMKGKQHQQSRLSPDRLFGQWITYSIPQLNEGIRNYWLNETSSIYQIVCNISTDDGKNTQEWKVPRLTPTMLQSMEKLKKGNVDFTVIAATDDDILNQLPTVPKDDDIAIPKKYTLSSSTSSCQYVFRLTNLIPLTMYEVQIVTLQEIISPATVAESVNRNLLIQETETYTYSIDEGSIVSAARSHRYQSSKPSPASSRIRTRGLPRSTLADNLRTETNIPGQSQLPLRGSGAGLRSKDNFHRLLQQLPEESFLCTTDTAPSTPSYQILTSATTKDVPAKDDPEYVPLIAHGGHAQNIHGGNGMVVISLFTEGGSEPLETITYRYRDPVIDHDRPSSTVHSSSSVLHRTILLQPFDNKEEQDPRTYTYRIPGSATGGGEAPDITRVLVRAWGAGGGCGTRILQNNGTLDDGTYLYRHPTNNDVITVLPSVCVPGGSGSFVRTWLRVQPGYRLIIFPGTGGKAGFSSPDSSSSVTLGQAGWPGGGAGGKGRKTGGGGGGASIVYLVTVHDPLLQDLSSGPSLADHLFHSRIPTLLAAGGGGGGASDYSLPAGGNGGGCNGYDGDSPRLSPRPLALELADPNTTAGSEGNRTLTLREYRTDENGTVPWDNTYDPVLGSRAIPYQEHIDMGFMPQNNYVVMANGGKGGQLRTRTGGDPGRSGSIYISGSANSYGVGKDASIPTDGNGDNDWVMNNEGSLYQPSGVMAAVRGLVTVPASGGGWLFAGNGGSGWEGGGGGGAGIFAGGGGGSGIDGSGGGGGSSYIDPTYVLEISSSLPRPSLSLVTVNSVSVMFAWLPMMWPGQSVSSIVYPLSSSTMGAEAREYVIERAIGLYDDNFVQVWNGPGTKLLRQYVPPEADPRVQTLFRTPVSPLYTILSPLSPKITYRFRIYAVHPKGNTSLLSEPVIVTTPDYLFNQWKVIQGLPTIDERTGPSTMHYDTSYPQTPLPPPLRGASTTVIDGYVYVFGGLSPGYDCGYGPLALACPGHSAVRNETWRLDPTSWSWYQLPIPPLLTPPARERHTAVNIDNRLYILGGRSHPDTTRDGGPYLDDMWVLELGDDNEAQRTSLHSAVSMVPDTLTGMSMYTNTDHYSLSCGTMNKNSPSRSNTSFYNPLNQSCGLPELIEPILTLQVREDRDVPTGNTTGSAASSSPTVTVPDDSCVDKVEVWIEFVHPCLQDIEIRLIGPGPAPLRAPFVATHDVAHDVWSGTLNNFYDGNVNSTNSTHPLQTLGPQRVILFQGGKGQGTAAASWFCNVSLPSSRLSSVYFPRSGKVTFGTEASTYEGSMVPGYDIVTALLHDRLAVFDDEAPRSSDTCCNWENANDILPSFRAYKAPTNATITDILETYANEVRQDLPSDDDDDGDEDMDRDTTSASSGTRFHEDELRYQPSMISLLEGHYKPFDALHVFRGTRAKGQWGLQVIDRVQNNITGEVRRWGLVLRTVPCQKKYVWTRLYPPVTMNPSSTTPANGTDVSSLPSPSRFVRALPPLTRLPPARVDASSIVIGTSVFVWGGQGIRSYTLPDGKDLWRYDALTNEWILLQPSIQELRSTANPFLFSSTFYENYLRKEYLIGTGMQQYGVLTSIGLIAWGGIPHSSVSQTVEETLPGYPLHSEADECINSRGTWNAHDQDTGGTYACTHYALLTTVWDFHEQRWRRLHPSKPISSLFRKTDIHDTAFLTPIHVRYTALNVIGDYGIRNRALDVPGPTLFIIGGAEVMSGTIQDMRIWTLRINETTALGDPYPSIETGRTEKNYREQSLLKSKKWQDLCTPLLLPDSPSYTDWYRRCMRPEYRTDDGSLMLPPSSSVCPIETIILRAWCEGEYQSIGMI